VHEFFVTFIALFVAVDIVGVLPVYLGFVAALDVETRQRVALEATITAAGIGIGFLLLGDAVLRVAGVGVGDFQMACGLLLLILAIHDLLHPELPLRQPGGHLGVLSNQLPPCILPGPWGRRAA
jgi:multiple antibiotic resistance protein